MLAYICLNANAVEKMDFILSLIKALTQGAGHVESVLVFVIPFKVQRASTQSEEQLLFSC